MNKVIRTLQQADTVAFLHQSWIDHFSVVWSYATNTQSNDSDVDVIYESNKNIWWELFDITQYLEKKLGKKIDIIERRYLRSSIAKSVLEHKIDII